MYPSLYKDSGAEASRLALEINYMRLSALFQTLSPSIMKSLHSSVIPVGHPGESEPMRSNWTRICPEDDLIFAMHSFADYWSSNCTIMHSWIPLPFTCRSSDQLGYKCYRKAQELIILALLFGPVGTLGCWFWQYHTLCGGIAKWIMWERRVLSKARTGTQ